MQIRKATSNDIAAIELIEEDALGTSLGKQFLTNELNNNPFANYFIVEIKKTPVGYIGIRIVDDHAEIINVAVLSAYQNQGYGTFLFEEVLTLMTQYGVRGMSLEVRRSNERAIRFYQKFGFEQTRLRPNYYQNEDALVFFKEFEHDYYGN